MPYFTANNQRLFYREQGSGPLLLILHGNTASSAMHAGELAYFGQRYHAVALDLPGCGQSQREAVWPDDWWAQGGHAAAALVQHLGYPRALVMGTSGGIDSAVTACVAVDALGAERVNAVSMPSRYSSMGTRNDARETAEHLGARYYEISIESLYESYLRELAAYLDSNLPGLTEQNIQARIRGNLLMALSNRFGWLVLTTGNKSETAVGYATLYGDMAGGFAVLKDVPKTLVYRLADYRNSLGPGAGPIPASTVQRAPSAELAADQVDQDTLPPYDILDRVIEAYVVNDDSVDEIASLGIDKALVERVVAMIDHNEYKRRQAAPGVRITPKAFGKDRRLPITNRYRG